MECSGIQWIIESGALLVLTLAMTMAMAMFRVLLAFFHCRYYVSFLFVELALISNGFLLFILLLGAVYTFV